MFKDEVLSALLRVAVSDTTFRRLYRLLPFPTRIVSGHTYNHIQYLGAYDIETPSRYGTRTVTDGDTLCRRAGRYYVPDEGYQHEENCPGCDAIARGIIARDIENA